MENFVEQLEELKTLLSTNTTKPYKSSAYSTLLHIQEQSVKDNCLIRSLAESSPALLTSIFTDIAYEDEEIATQALKCLGFMIYHPSIVANISGDDANMIVNSLEKVIITTKIKSVCNLGVWCLSIQQFNASFLEAHFPIILRAVVYALDNPIGSLSTTFEAIQAVMKLETQLSEKMRDASNIWAPPIYRRLVSIDKREKDMAERCLLKIRSTVCPPPPALSKVLVVDLKRTLLSAMKELLNQGMKIQTLQAWGWFVRLMGPYATKNRHLVNELLKIPEQTFSDSDPQVQTASQVAWEGLVDALINPCGSEPEAYGLAKSMKLIMTPLVGIMSSKCDLSVHSSCLNTWCYLLHKLNSFVNCPTVRKTVFEPILEVVFRAGPDSRNIWSWNFCLDLVESFALARSEDPRIEVTDDASDQPLAKAPTITWKHYPIKWLPWDSSHLDFHIRIIQILIGNVFLENITPEIKSLACDATLRIFRSALVGVQLYLKRSSITYSEVMLCLNTIVLFLKKTCEDAADSEGQLGNEMCLTSLKLIELTIEELEPSMLGSPLYKLMIDAKYMDNSEQVNALRHAKELYICSNEKDGVSPVVYLTALCFHLMLKLTSNAPGISRYVRLLLSLFDPDILNALIGFLYKYVAFDCLSIWMAIANSLKDNIDVIKDLLSWKTDSSNTGYLVISHLLSYPFAHFSWPQRRLSLLKTEKCPLYSMPQIRLEVGNVVELWKLIYASVNHISRIECSSSKNFFEDLFCILSGYLDDYIDMLESGTVVDPMEQIRECDLLSLSGDIATYFLEQSFTLEFCNKGNKLNDGVGFGRINAIINSLGFVTRFLRLSYRKVVTNTRTTLDATSRVFSMLAHFIGSLHSTEDITPFLEIISSPLLQWLSIVELQDASISCELQRLWICTLKCLQKSWPPIIFDSTLLKLQAPLLEVTLDHPNPSISNPTITFWNSTYGEQFKLDYPQSLLPILDKLSRNRKINLCKRNQQYKVNATLNRCSKRVQLVEDKGNKSGSKRKHPELTEHQKEVRRSQQGRSLDCEGRGPGLRTYTSVDFSQGNEESQESQEIQNAEAILEMLKTDGKLV